jgi:hypothetical protein
MPSISRRRSARLNVAHPITNPPWSAPLLHVVQLRDNRVHLPKWEPSRCAPAGVGRAVPATVTSSRPSPSCVENAGGWASAHPPRLVRLSEGAVAGRRVDADASISTFRKQLHRDRLGWGTSSLRSRCTCPLPGSMRPSPAV